MGAKVGNTPVVRKRWEGPVQPEPEAEGVSASKMIITGIVIGAVLCGGFVLFLMLSGSSTTGSGAGTQQRSGQTQSVAASANGNSNASQQSSETANAAASQANKNGDPRNKKRRGSSSGGNSKYQDVYTVSGSGKPPKMVQSQ
jgi:hypothetical protein